MKFSLSHSDMARLLVVASVVAIASGCQSSKAWFAKRAEQSSQLVDKMTPPAFARAKSTEQGTTVAKTTGGNNAELAAAKAAERKGDTDRAVSLYEELVAKDPDNVEALHRLAVSYDRKGDHDKAGGQYFAALRVRPNDPEILADLGYSLYLQGNHVGGERALRDAIAQDPNSRRAHNNLGLVLARRGQQKEALSQFALGGCSEPEARANLIHGLLMEDRWDEALRQCEIVRSQPSVPSHVAERVAQLRTMIVRAKADSPNGTKNATQLARNNEPHNNGTRNTMPVSYEANVPTNPIR